MTLLVHDVKESERREEGKRGKNKSKGGKGTVAERQPLRHGKSVNILSLLCSPEEKNNHLRSSATSNKYIGQISFFLFFEVLLACVVLIFTAGKDTPMTRFVGCTRRTGCVGPRDQGTGERQQLSIR